MSASPQGPLRPSTSPHVSIVIPNWNGARFLRTCLTALQTQTYRDFEILLVDNGSTDESRELVAREYPRVQLIGLEKNLGFVGGCKAGMRAVTAPNGGQAKSEILVLLNNDTEAETTWGRTRARSGRKPPRGNDGGLTFTRRFQAS